MKETAYAVPDVRNPRAQLNRALQQIPATGSRALGLAAFRNAHPGETIIVCGCGPSLLELTEPKRFITIGVNDVGRQFDPTYLVVLNPRSQFKGDRFSYIEQSKAKALFTQLDLGRVQPPLVRFKLGKYGGTDTGTGEFLHYTQNSPYVAVCLAAYMGATRIGLIGVDLTDDHFFARTGRHSLSGRVGEIDTQYGRLAKALSIRGIETFNLSAHSRLEALPRQNLSTSHPAGVDAGCSATVQLPTRALPNTGEPMKIAVEVHRPGLVGDFLDALAATAVRLGHTVRRDVARLASDPEVTNIVWNGRSHRARGPTLYCEHGWLPRWSYQISPAGINADSHLAPFVWNGTALEADESGQLDAHLEEIRSQPPAGFEYMQTTSAVAAGLPDAFLLVPLQMEWDTNIVRHAPAKMRLMQGLIDAVARAAPPWPIIFKQHPADVRRGNAQLRLRLRRTQDAIWPHTRGNVYQMLKSDGCRGIVSINSNVVHDGLLWNVPAVALGRNLWPTDDRGPFRTVLPGDWQAFAASRDDPALVNCRRAYAWHLKRGQWTLDDATNPERVGALFNSVRGRRISAPRPANRPRASVATVNVVAINRGWVFEDLKGLFAQQSRPGIRVISSERPLQRADAWIFLRTREAACTPNPDRTLVQIHDMFDHGLYRRGGERYAVNQCAAVALSHPDQRSILESNGIDLSARLVIDRPLGWRTGFEVRRSMMPRLTVAWVGRPAVHYGVEVKRVDWFVDAVASLNLDVEVVLLGERLEAAANRLRQAGVSHRYLRRKEYPADRYPELYAGFDCLVISSSTEAGPLPLFEAMACGIPVISTPVGWAPRLIEHGETGFLINDVLSLREAIRAIAETRDVWFERRHAIRSKVQAMSLGAWIDANLEVAVGLALRCTRAAA